MKKYKVILLGDNIIYITGWLNIYKHHYLIIDENSENNYFPKSKSVILTITE